MTPGQLAGAEKRHPELLLVGPLTRAKTLSPQYALGNLQVEISHRVPSRCWWPNVRQNIPWTVGRKRRTDLVLGQQRIYSVSSLNMLSMAQEESLPIGMTFHAPPFVVCGLSVNTIEQQVFKSQQNGFWLGISLNQENRPKGHFVAIQEYGSMKITALVRELRSPGTIAGDRMTH